jgi:hypothetical protein
MTHRQLMMGTALLLAACGQQAEEEGRNMTANEVAEELANVRIEPGLWETTSEVVNISAPNLPRELQQQMKGRAATADRHCITPEQAARPDANFLAGRENSNCTYRDFSMRGGRMQGTMICTGGDMPGQATATMDGEYGPESYDMRMRMEMTGPAEVAMTIETRAQGRRVGDCPPEGEQKQ